MMYEKCLRQSINSLKIKFETLQTKLLKIDLFKSLRKALKCD